jgi:hypothetical protein
MWLTVFGGRGVQATALLASAKAATATVAPVITSTLSSFSTPRIRTAETTSQSSQPPASRRVRPAQTTPLARTALDVSRAHLAALSFEPVRTPSQSEPKPSERRATAGAPIGVLPGERSEPLEPAAIYSHDDADVEPPVMLRPQLPPALMVGASPGGAVNRMELVVAADGTVERVKLVNGPRRMADMMLLSGAKLWKFSPAVKNGEPVRYRTTVSWSGFP